MLCLVLAGVPFVAPFSLPCSLGVVRRGAQATDSLPSVRLAGLAPGRNVRQVQGGTHALSMAAVKKSALSKALIKVTGSLTVSRLPYALPVVSDFDHLSPPTLGRPRREGRAPGARSQRVPCASPFWSCFVRGRESGSLSKPNYPRLWPRAWLWPNATKGLGS